MPAWPPKNWSFLRSVFGGQDFVGMPSVKIPTFSDIPTIQPTAARVSLVSNFSGIGSMQLEKLSKVDTKWMRNFMSNIPKPFRTIGGIIGRNPKTAAIGLTTLTMGVNMLGGLLKSFRSEPVGRIASSGTGPGYISWAKRSGMPRNHMSSDGISLALHKMRHASTI